MISQDIPSPVVSSASISQSNTVTLTPEPDAGLPAPIYLRSVVGGHGNDFPLDAKDPVLRTADHEAEDRDISLARRLTDVHLEWPNEAGVSVPLFLLSCEAFFSFRRDPCS